MSEITVLLSSFQIYWLSQLPMLNNLKDLELVACGDDGIILSACVILLKASPSLCRFTIKVNISLCF